MEQLCIKQIQADLLFLLSNNEMSLSPLLRCLYITLLLLFFPLQNMSELVITLFSSVFIHHIFVCLLILPLYSSG